MGRPWGSGPLLVSTRWMPESRPPWRAFVDSGPDSAVSEILTFVGKPPDPSGQISEFRLTSQDGTSVLSFLGRSFPDARVAEDVLQSEADP